MSQQFRSTYNILQQYIDIFNNLIEVDIDENIKYILILRNQQINYAVYWSDSGLNNKSNLYLNRKTMTFCRV